MSKLAGLLIALVTIALLYTIGAGAALIFMIFGALVWQIAIYKARLDDRDH